MSKIADIAAHVQENSSIQVGIGAYSDPRGTDQHRVNAIRDALV